jgi:hypothetical protein
LALQIAANALCNGVRESCEFISVWYLKSTEF